jgi:hypothetical protein
VQLIEHDLSQRRPSSRSRAAGDARVCLLFLCQAASGSSIAECFEPAVAVGASSGEQSLRVGMEAGLSERKAVQGGVQLPVAAAAESMASPVRRPDRH